MISHFFTAPFFLPANTTFSEKRRDRVTNFFESELFEPIDLCSCFDPIFDPPPEQVAAWKFSEPEPPWKTPLFMPLTPTAPSISTAAAPASRSVSALLPRARKWSTLWRTPSSLRPGLPDTPDCFRQQILAKTLIPAHTYGTIKLEAW